VSPSGRGLHVWGRADLSRGRCLTFRGQPVEVYPSGRYMTVTGNRYPESSSTLGDLSAVLATVFV
jgi:primase-polymerase (primpol)-like protein